MDSANLIVVEMGENIWVKATLHRYCKNSGIIATIHDEWNPNGINLWFDDGEWGLCH